MSMLQSFVVSVQAVLPLFLMMLLGFFARCMHFVEEKEVKRFNGLIFNILFPFLVFHNLYQSDLSSVFDAKLIFYSVFATLFIFIISFLIIPKIERDDESRGAMIQAIYRSNYVLLGIPLVSNIYPNSDLGMIAVCIAFLIPVYNILAVIVLEYYRGGRVTASQLFLGMVKNPLVIGCVAGLLAIPFPIPSLVGQTISHLASAATPMALILLGASFQLKSNPKLRRNIWICTASRLMIVPAIFLSIAVALGFRGMPFVVLIAVFTTPCSVSSFTMAQQMDSDAELSGAIVVYTSALSCFTMFFWTFLFHQIGVF